jgi:hypothetical protein
VSAQEVEDFASELRRSQMVKDKDRDEYERGLIDREKGTVDQMITDITVDHPDSEAYYKGREGRQLDDDKEEKK